MNNKIILASASPRRIEMMKENGFDPIIIPSEVNEDLPFEMTMERAVMYLALKKALNVESISKSSGITSCIDSSGHIIIAADTIVYKDQIIGKPANMQDALRILNLLRNTNHFVATGVAIIDTSSSNKHVFYEITEVFFKNYSDKEIEDYLKTDEPWDKAGAYAIQGAWGKHVSHYKGDYNNVIGFPIERIQNYIKNSL